MILGFSVRNMEIMEQIKENIPKSAEISDISFEGCEIILYTTSKDFFRNSSDLIRSLVNKIKKRVEVRADPELVVEEEKTLEFIRNTVPKEAGIRDIYFEPEFARVVIHAEKPGLVIGKSGETLNEIKNKTFWSVDIKRAPVIDSELIRSIRRMLHNEAGYRKKFLNKTGKYIYGDKKDVDWIRFTALGGFKEVGRSSVFLQTNNSRVLLDCGISAGYATKPFPYIDSPEFRIQDLNAIVLSHAHLDHSGLIPFLYEYGYRGPLYCTAPTRDIMSLLLMDYISLAQKENKKPPYTSKGIEEAVKHCITLDYGQVTDITPDMRITLQNAGHILGSSTIHVHIGDGLYNLLYTGDIKYERTKMFEKAWTDYSRVEAMIIESTYGADEDEKQARVDSEKILIDKIKETINRGGRVLIPSFAVGRAQDIIVALTESDIDVPIYLDGMLWDATAIHTAYPEYMSRYIQNLVLRKGKNPFIDPRLKGIGSNKERKELVDSVHPAVVVSTSGMLSGGPVLEYLKHFSKEPKNTLVFVGYQGEGTMGRRIQKGWKHIQMEDGTDIELNLEIITVEGMSDHSYRNQLMDFINDMKVKPRKIIVNHGEASKCVALAKAIHKTFKASTLTPQVLETIRLK